MMFITDRTQADVNRAKAIIAKLQSGEALTDAEQAEYDAGLKGCYNYTDINRVRAAVTALAASLNAEGYKVAVTPVLAGESPDALEDRDFTETDAVYKAQWENYINNVRAIRDAFYTFDDTGPLPQPDERINYAYANNVEKVLEDVDALLWFMTQSYRRCGALTAGNNAVTLPLRGSV